MLKKHQDGVMTIEMETLQKKIEVLTSELKIAHKNNSHCEQVPSILSSEEYIKSFPKYIRASYFSTYGKSGINKNIDLWDLWEEQGVHVLPIHYYSPIVATDQILAHYSDSVELDMAGVNMNDDMQRTILQAMISTYKDEVANFPADSSDAFSYGYKGAMFGLQDASLYHTMVRRFAPSKIVEVGSGQSLKVSLAASAMNAKPAEITVIEPFPDQDHNKHLLEAPGISQLVVKKIQDVDLDLFKTLKENDILFLDSSHAVGPGSDTVTEILKILPHLAPGVIVHIHDIFLPFDQPKQWVIKQRRFWSEQYLLHAFLLFNADFEVLAGSYFIKNKFSNDIADVMPPRFSQNPGGSFWFRRKAA